jgi:uncharacterized YigZ family protein
MPEPDSYRTLKKDSTGSFRDRGSKFLAFAYPVRSVEEANRILGELRKKYHDARHHCYAYRLGSDKMTYRTHDDGEPSNSAGKPVLGQILAFDLSDVLVVVVRYFGGTLLGVGGLINAYRSSARDALENAEIILRTVDVSIEISFPYTAMDRVMKVLDQEKMKIREKEFTETCRIRASVRKSKATAVTEALGSIPGVKVVNYY